MGPAPGSWTFEADPWARTDGAESDLQAHDFLITLDEPIAHL